MAFPRFLIPLTAALALASGAAAAQTLKTANGALVDAGGRTVYTFDKDTAGSGKSACNGPCATAWPPVPAMGEPAAPYSAITREDGSKQLAYNGKPLYLYSKDGAAGERKGDNFKDVWHVAKP